MRAYVKIDHYEAGTNARAWLFCVARNLFINDYRKRKRRGEQELEERSAYQYRDTGSPMAGFADLRIAGALDRDFSDPIMRAMSLLNDKQRAICTHGRPLRFRRKGNRRRPWICRSIR